MAEANLGFLGQFLGGLATGKQMKQKKQIATQEFEYKKQRNKFEADDRTATAAYRANQLALGGKRLELEQKKFAKEEAGGDFYAKSITDVRNRIITAADEYEKRLNLAANGREFVRIKDAATADLTRQMKVLNNMATNPVFDTTYPGSTVQDREGIFKAGIPSWVENPDMDAFRPDFYARYKANNQGLLNNRRDRQNAGFDTPESYFASEIPQYKKIISDLDDGSGNTDAAINKAIELYGPLPGTDYDQTFGILKTGTVAPAYGTNADYQFGEPVKIPELDPVTGAPTGRQIDSFSSIPRLLTEQQRRALPNPDSDIQRISPYVQPIPVPFGTQIKKLEAPARLSLLDNKAKLEAATLEDKIKASFFKSNAIEQKFKEGREDLRIKAAKAYVEEFKALNLPEKYRAELNKILTDTDKSAVSIVTGLKNWETNTLKVYSAATSVSFNNYNKANTTFANNMNIEAVVKKPENQNAITTYLNSINPDAVLPFAVAQSIGGAAVEAIRGVKDARNEWLRNQKAENDLKAGGLLKARDAMNAALTKISGSNTLTPASTGPSSPAATARTTRPAASTSRFNPTRVNVPRPNPK